MDSTTTYWAAEADETKLGKELQKRKDAAQQFMLGSEDLKWIRKSHRMAIGEAPRSDEASSREVIRTGDNDQVLKVNANHYGSLIRGIVTLTTSQEVALQPKAKNSDGENQSIVTIGGDLLDSYMHDGLAARLEKQVSQAVKYRKSYLLKLVDEADGEEVATEQAQPHQVARGESGEVVAVAKEGKHVFHTLTPLEVYFDCAAPEESAVDWHIARTWANKWNLATKCAEAAVFTPPDEHGVPADYETKLRKITSAEPSGMDDSLRLDFNDRRKKLGSDLIPVFHFLHKRTAALPEGRHVCFLADGTVLKAGPLRYPEYPLFGLVPDDKDDSADGNAPAWDLMGLCEGTNMALSIALTKESNSLPILCFTHDSGVAPADLKIPYRAVKVKSKDHVPTVVVPTASASESVALGAKFQSQAETLSGMNSVTRGQPQEALSGNAPASLAALIVEQAYVSNTKLLANYKRLCGALGKAILADYPVFFPGQRKLKAIAGKARAQMVREFEGKSLAAIEGVEVDAGNPAARSLSGRMAMIDVIKQSGHKVEPDKLVEAFQTGKWDPAIESLQSEAKQIREENEAMAQGQQIPPAVIGEDQLAHVFGHTARTVADKLRGDLESIRLEHIQSHAALISWNGLPPEDVARLSRMGFAPPMPPPMPGMPGPAPPSSGAASPSAPPMSAEEAAAPMDGIQPGPGAEQLPNLPEPASVPGGVA